MPDNPRGPKTTPTGSGGKSDKKRTSFMAGVQMQNTDLLSDIINADREKFGRAAPEPAAAAEYIEESTEESSSTSNAVDDTAASSDATYSQPDAVRQPAQKLSGAPSNAPSKAAPTRPLRTPQQQEQEEKRSNNIIKNTSNNYDVITSNNVIKNTSASQNPPQQRGRKGRKRKIHPFLSPEKPMSFEEAVAYVRQEIESTDQSTTPISVHLPNSLHRQIDMYLARTMIEGPNGKATKLDVLAHCVALGLVTMLSGEVFVDFSEPEDDV